MCSLNKATGWQLEFRDGLMSGDVWYVKRELQKQV